MQPNATQIRTMTNQATAFKFSSRYLSQQSGCEDVSQSQTTSRKVSLGTVCCCVSFGERDVLAPLLPLLFAEPIAETAHRFNYIAGFAKFFAQAAHMRVHGAGVDHAFVAPDVIEQFIAILHPASALD